LTGILYSRGATADQNAYPANEANREQTNQVEEEIKRGGHTFAVTPVSLPINLAFGRDSEFSVAKDLAKVFGKKIVWIRADGREKTSATYVIQASVHRPPHSPYRPSRRLQHTKSASTAPG